MSNREKVLLQTGWGIAVLQDGKILWVTCMRRTKKEAIDVVTLLAELNQ